MEGTRKRGLDISYCQKGLDLSKAKANGVEYVIIRAGISTRTDTDFKAHTEGAIKAGLPYGFYWYSRAFSTADARNEAAACLEAIKPYDPTYPVYYDMEEQEQIDKLNKATRTAIITTFCDAVRAAGRTVGVYINPAWLEDHVDKTQIVGKYDIWLAHWTNSPDKPSRYDYGQRMLQWGVDKICGMDVDGDVCYFDYEQHEKTPSAAPVIADSNVIYRSLSVVAKRKKADRNGDMTDQCERGGYYAASQLVTPAAGSQQWFRHADTDLYSALTDVPEAGSIKLFEQYGTYTVGKTNAPVNVRVSPGLDTEKIVLLEKGHTVYLTGETKQVDGVTWVQAVYNGQLVWIDKKWINI